MSEQAIAKRYLYTCVSKLQSEFINEWPTNLFIQ